ncbi:MAG: DUF6064 family protein [Halobacteriota archaeon]
MVTSEAIWNFVDIYNNAIFPMQIVTLIVAIILTCLLFAKPGVKINNLMKAYLAFTYAWIGVMFAIISVPPSLSPQFPILGIILIVIALLFAMDIFAGKTEFKLPDRGQRYFTLFLIGCAFILYPLIGWIIHHHSLMTMLLGVFPCPTTIFSIALLAGAIPKVDKKVFVLLLCVALSSGIFGPMMGIYVDFLLLVPGVYGLVMLVKNWGVIGK